MNDNELMNALKNLLALEERRVSKPVWYAAAKIVSQMLTEQNSIKIRDGDFHHLMHYFADYDIRLNDSNYQEVQLRGVREILRELSANSSR